MKQTLRLLPLVFVLAACDSESPPPEPPANEPREVALAPAANEPRSDIGGSEAATIRLFEQSKDAVVHITTTQRVIDPWSRNVFNMPRGNGSGFIWDNKGHVVTNHHVVAGASGAKVRLNDGRDYDATLVGVSPAHDIAVLRIRIAERQPRPLPVGRSHNLKVGQSVYAIGNPFGLDWSLTTGVVSALNRSLPAGDGQLLIQQLIQTDAAINPGNSGGPLLDSGGRLIGMNTAIFSPSGAYAGVGFAVPVDTISRVVPSLITNGKYVRPVLGVQTDESLNEMLATRVGIQGIVVAGVERGSPADAAGLRPARIDRGGGIVPGDIILAIDGKPVNTTTQLITELDAKAIGQTVTLTVLRDGERTDIKARLKAGT